MKPFLTFTFILSSVLLHPHFAADLPQENLNPYSVELAACRAAHGSSYSVADAK